MVRMMDSIDSEVHKASDEFRASLTEDLVIDGTTVVQRGAHATVKLVRVEESGQLRGREQVSIELDSLTVEGKDCYRLL